MIIKMPYDLICKIDEISLLVQDARTWSIRWDLIPWSLVLDVDLENESLSLPRRAWLIFEAVSALTLPLSQINSPMGLWITSEIKIRSVATSNMREREFSFRIISTLAGQGDIKTPQATYIDCGVIARSVHLCVGPELQKRGTFADMICTRLRAAPDQEMLEIIRQQQADLFEYEHAAIQTAEGAE